MKDKRPVKSVMPRMVQGDEPHGSKARRWSEVAVCWQSSPITTGQKEAEKC